MNNKGLEKEIRDEILHHLSQRRSLRLRVFYRVRAELLDPDAPDWQQGIACLQERHGDRIKGLSQLADFKLFRLHPEGGRYVKGFGKAYQIEGGSLSGERLSHLRGAHIKRERN